jgi:Icc-related predicted phosphoesterase
MKLLLFSDLHRDRAAARRIVELSREADIVIGAGDFATKRIGLAETLDELRAIDKPAVLVPGNAESFEELQSACADWPSAVVLHGTGATVAGVEFFGLGGAVPTTPFGAWSYDFTEAEAELLLQACPHGGVLVSHSPPCGLLDTSSAGKSLGSAAVLAAVERCRPWLVVCGHVHDSSGKQICRGETTIINAGPRGMFFDF